MPLGPPSTPARTATFAFPRCRRSREGDTLRQSRQAAATLIDPDALAGARRGGGGPRSGIPTGWIVVAALTTILTATSGARFLFGVVLKPVSEELGWDRASLTAAVTIGMVALALCQPFVGVVVDRVGAKRVLVTGTLLLGSVLIPLSSVTRLWQVYLLYGLVASLGFAATSPVNATALVGRWFGRRRGTAMAIATSGSAFGQLLVVPLATWTLTLTDWRTAYRGLAAVLLLGMVPLGLFLLRDAPARADGTPAAPSVLEGVGLRAAARTPTFWALAFGFLVCGFTMAFPNTHFIAYVDDMGMAPLHAANAVAVTAVFSIVGSVLLGMAADRRGRAPILAATYALRGAAFALLLVLPAGDLLFVYAVVLGISWTATTPLTAAIAADVYGSRHLGAVFGTLFTFMNVGFGVGALADGLIYELVGGYEIALGFNAALGVAAALVVWSIPADRRRHVGAELRAGLGAGAAD